MEEKKSDYDYIVTPYQESISNFFHIPFTVFWSLYTAITISIDVFVLFKYQESKEVVIPHIILGFLPGVIAISTIWFSKILENFTPSLFMFIDWTKERTLNWYSAEIRSIFNFKRMALSGFLMAVIMVPLSFQGPLMPIHIIPSASFILMMVSMNFLAGSLIYVLVRICCMVNHLGEIESIKISVYQHPLSSIKAVGKLMGQISMATMLIYILAVSFHIFTRSDPMMISITIFFGIFVLFIFIFPQIKIHKIMSNVKYKKIRCFATYLEDALEKVTEDPSPENVQRVKELFGVQQSLSQMGEWPFETRVLFPILTGIAIPIIVALLQLIFKN